MRSRPWRSGLVLCSLAIGIAVSPDTAAEVIAAKVIAAEVIAAEVIVAEVIAAEATAGEVASPLSLSRITVEPERPAEETLCKLSVEVSNSTDGSASYLAFAVRLNGEPLAVYENLLFVQEIAPQSSTTVDLFNFWSTESDRPLPTNGELTIEVLLLEAQWAEIEIEKGVEIWTPTGTVPGLPVSSRRILQLP